MPPAGNTPGTPGIPGGRPTRRDLMLARAKAQAADERRPQAADEVPTFWRPGIRIAEITDLNDGEDDNVDALIAKFVDAEGDTYGADIYVARPTKLRHSSSEYPLVHSLTTVDANEVEVSDEEEETTEDWIVTPVYTVGDLIAVARVGYTGITIDDVDIELIDINVDGRAWAVKSA